MVSDKEQHPAAIIHHLLDMAGNHFAEMWPAEVEHAAQITKRLNNSRRGAGDDRDIDPAVHTFQDHDGGGMFCPVEVARQTGFRAAVLGGVALGQVE